MNWLDLLIVMALVVAAVGAYRLGFLSRMLSWIGMGLGVAVALKAIPWVLERLEGASSGSLTVLTVALLLLGAFLGQAIGLLVGQKLHVTLPSRGAEQADHVAGAVAGAAMVGVVVWLLVPVLADTPGWLAQETRESAIARFVATSLPPAPDATEAIRDLVGDEQFPRVFDALRPTPDLGPPPVESGIPPDLSAQVEQSVVKIEGVACERKLDGSGFAVGEGVVVTNAHVVAGEGETQVIEVDGTAHDATVVSFDPNRDLAVLAVPGLDSPPLPVGDAGEGDIGGVYGFPGGGGLRIAPFEIGRRVVAHGRDIYNSAPTTRDVFELSSALQPGDSGSALVDPQGAVVGVAFAIAPDRADVAYAVTSDELLAVLEGDLESRADTGPCLG